TLVLTAPNTYTGITNVKNGAVTLDFSAAGAPASNILSPDSSLALGGGLSGATNGALNIKGAGSGVTSQSFVSTAVDFGANAISVNQNGASAMNLSLGAVTRSNHGALNLTPPVPGVI